MINIIDLPELSYNGQPALPPQKDDLERLYNIIIDNFIVTVLEIGCGYSTIVIEQALKENRIRWNELEKKPEMRNPNMFECHSIDNNDAWVEEVIKYSSSCLYTIECEIESFNGMMCHRYNKLPPILPDLIYLDGPDPLSIWPINMPMSADLLYIEPILIPGTIVLVDGRTNNMRFLQRNLQRNWSYEYSPEEDYTLMVLEERRLGKINVIGRDILEAIK